MTLTHQMIRGNVAILYGFESGPRYELIATIAMGVDRCFVHGLMTRKRLKRQDIKQLCKYIGDLCFPAQVGFQVTPPSHFRAYEPYLKVFSKESSKTFNGFDAVTVEVMYKEEQQ
jgi:hypothetical protein